MNARYGNTYSDRKVNTEKETVYGRFTTVTR